MEEHHIPISRARDELSRLVADAQGTEKPYILTQHGTPRGVLLSYQSYCQLMEDHRLATDGPCMRQLWAPWRMAYIKQAPEPGCVFCNRVAADDDAANLILVRRKGCFIILNAYPYNPGHLLVIPYRHTSDLTALSADELGELMLTVRDATTYLTRAMAPHGFNVGMNLGAVAGAGIADHAHIHVVPRWTADTNFMPILAGTKPLPELLQETYTKLRAAVNNSVEGDI